MFLSNNAAQHNTIVRRINAYEQMLTIDPISTS